MAGTGHLGMSQNADSSTAARWLTGTYLIRHPPPPLCSPPHCPLCAGMWNHVGLHTGSAQFRSPLLRHTERPAADIPVPVLARAWLGAVHSEGTRWVALWQRHARSTLGRCLTLLPRRRVLCDDSYSKYRWRRSGRHDQGGRCELRQHAVVEGGPKVRDRVGRWLGGSHVRQAGGGGRACPLNPLSPRVALLDLTGSARGRCCWSRFCAFSWATCLGPAPRFRPLHHEGCRTAQP
jgi:hypothetical protein